MNDQTHIVSVFSERSPCLIQASIATYFSNICERTFLFFLQLNLKVWNPLEDNPKNMDIHATHTHTLTRSFNYRCDENRGRVGWPSPSGDAMSGQLWLDANVQRRSRCASLLPRSCVRTVAAPQKLALTPSTRESLCEPFI